MSFGAPDEGAYCPEKGMTAAVEIHDYPDNQCYRIRYA